MRSEIAIASLLLDYINETSQTNHPGPSHLALREQGMGSCLIFINSIVDQVVFFLMNKSIRISKRHWWYYGAIGGSV